MRPLSFRRLEAHNLSRRDEKQRCSSYGSRKKKLRVVVIRNLMMREPRSRMEMVSLKIVKAKKGNRLIQIVAEDSNRRCLRRRRVDRVNARRKPRRQAHSRKEPNPNPKLNYDCLPKNKNGQVVTHHGPKYCENIVQKGSPSETFKRRAG